MRVPLLNRLVGARPREQGSEEPLDLVLH
jgi:hypothetical protein